MTKDTFISYVQEEISAACSIPFQVPKKEIERIIFFARKWFYKRHEDTVEQGFVMIEKKLFETEYFKNNKYIELCPEIISVYNVQKASLGLSYIGDYDPDFDIERKIMYETYLPNFSGDSLVYHVAAESFINLAEMVLLHGVRFDWNRLTHKLRFTGEIPKDNVILEVYSQIAHEYLYEEEHFYDYVVAKAKIQLGRILGTFDMPLPGDATINFSELKSEGEETLRRVEEEIRGDEGVDWFMMQ